MNTHARRQGKSATDNAGTSITIPLPDGFQDTAPMPSICTCVCEPGAGFSDVNVFPGPTRVMA